MPPYTKTLQLSLSCLLALLALILTWTSLAYADKPGDLDTRFNGNGIMTTTIGSDYGGGFGVVIQSDDKILVSGSSYNLSDSNYTITLLRFDDDGSLDTTFNSRGIVTTPLSPSFDYGFAVVTQADQKIVVAGLSYFSNASHIAVIRYTPSGSLDTSFNNTGIVSTTIMEGSEAMAVALQPDHKIVVAGRSYKTPGADPDITVARYTVSGTLDTSFNQSGIITTSLGDYNSAAYELVIQPNGKIIVVGSSYNASDSYLTLVRYTISGTLDTSFNQSGIITTPVGAGAVGHAVALQADGKIIVAGNADKSILLMRYNADGSLDPTLNGTGFVTTSVSTERDWATGVAVQPDGKIVVGGTSRDNDLNTSGDLTTLRYNSDGTLDSTFHNTGLVTTSIGSRRDVGYALALQRDGNIVVAGWNELDNGELAFAVVRYLGRFSTYLPLILKE